MAKVKNLIGKKFGRLTVIKFVETRGKSCHSYWGCKCKCGNTKVIRGSHLGSSSSCGCYAKEKSAKQLREYATSERHRGEGNPSWKGKNAGYQAVHQWLNRHYKKESCTHCGVKDKRLEWALIKGKEYAHDITNFMPLCSSCHKFYDYTDERRRKLSIKAKAVYKSIKNKETFSEKIYAEKQTNN